MSAFFCPFVPCVVLALLTIFILGWRAKPVDLEKALEELPEAPQRMNWLRVALSFFAFFLLVVAGTGLAPFASPFWDCP